MPLLEAVKLVPRWRTQALALPGKDRTYDLSTPPVARILREKYGGVPGELIRFSSLRNGGEQQARGLDHVLHREHTPASHGFPLRARP
jgi:hypothetical protein